MRATGIVQMSQVSAGNDMTVCCNALLKQTIVFIEELRHIASSSVNQHEDC